jgi:hypothetical protein
VTQKGRHGLTGESDSKIRRARERQFSEIHSGEGVFAELVASMTQPRVVSRGTRARIVKLFSTILLVSQLCGCTQRGDDESRVFDSLLLLVEEGEMVLENAKESWTPVQRDFLECVSQMSVGTFACEGELTKLENEYDEALASFSFNSLRAELQSLRLTSYEDASQARDAFVEHLRAWRDYISELRFLLPSNSDLFIGDYSFAQAWADVSTSEISRTFDETCSSLGNGQPSDNDEFAIRIVDICDD